MRLHALVSDLDTARAALAGGASVIQLRLKGLSTRERVRAGRPFRELGATLVVDDDLEAALQLGADGVHLGQADLERDESAAQRALAAGLLLGISSSSPEAARRAQRLGAGYLGAGPVWATPSKLDAGPPIGLEGLARVAAAVRLPVIAIGGVDAGNAAACIRAGAAGVAVIRAAADAARILAAIEAALG